MEKNKRKQIIFYIGMLMFFVERSVKYYEKRDSYDLFFLGLIIVVTIVETILYKKKLI